MTTLLPSTQRRQHIIFGGPKSRGTGAPGHPPGRLLRLALPVACGAFWVVAVPLPHGALPPHEALALVEVALVAHQACLPCGWCCGLNIMITIGVQAVLVYPAPEVWPWGVSTRPTGGYTSPPLHSSAVIALLRHSLPSIVLLALHPKGGGDASNVGPVNCCPPLG